MGYLSYIANSFLNTMGGKAADAGVMIKQAAVSDGIKTVDPVNALIAVAAALAAGVVIYIYRRHRRLGK